MQRRKEEARPTYHSRRATDQVLIDAYDNTSIREALQIVYVGLIALCVPILALVILGPMAAMGVI